MAVRLIRCLLHSSLSIAPEYGGGKGVIGVPLANRHTREARRCFGMFTNQLPLAYRLVRTERFCERVAFFQRELKRGFKHSKYPITLFNRDLAEQGREVAGVRLLR